jgi:hypothetical protein
MQIITKGRSYTVLATLAILLLAGCYPQGPEYAEDLDLVITYHKDDYDFQSKGKYAMPDKIVKITGNLVAGDEPSYIPDAVATAILTMIENNMTELGWERVELGENPDMLLTPASWETTTILYYYDYWYWWYGGYYPGWGGYYPAYVTTYSTGTLIMGLVDPEAVAANGNPVVQWSGALNGVLTGYYDANRISKGIDQIFDQSPYLKTN